MSIEPTTTSRAERVFNLYSELIEEQRAAKRDAKVHKEELDRIKDEIQAVIEEEE